MPLRVHGSLPPCHSASILLCQPDTMTRHALRPGSGFTRWARSCPCAALLPEPHFGRPVSRGRVLCLDKQKLCDSPEQMQCDSLKQELCNNLKKSNLPASTPRGHAAIVSGSRWRRSWYNLPLPAGCTPPKCYSSTGGTAMRNRALSLLRARQLIINQCHVSNIV